MCLAIDKESQQGDQNSCNLKLIRPKKLIMELSLCREEELECSAKSFRTSKQTVVSGFNKCVQWLLVLVRSTLYTSDSYSQTWLRSKLGFPAPPFDKIWPLHASSWYYWWWKASCTTKIRRSQRQSPKETTKFQSPEICHLPPMASNPQYQETILCGCDCAAPSLRHIPGSEYPSLGIPKSDHVTRVSLNHLLLEFDGNTHSQQNLNMYIYIYI